MVRLQHPPVASLPNTRNDVGNSTLDFGSEGVDKIDRLSSQNGTLCKCIRGMQGLNHVQSRDSSFTYLHLHSSHHADLLEDFTRVKLPAEEIYVPTQHQPINPDDEDDVVPDQHAAFGIQRATQKPREPAWRDLGLERLMTNGPPHNQANGAASTASSSRVVPR